MLSATGPKLQTKRRNPLKCTNFFIRQKSWHQSWFLNRLFSGLYQSCMQKEQTADYLHCVLYNHPHHRHHHHHHSFDCLSLAWKEQINGSLHCASFISNRPTAFTTPAFFKQKIENFNEIAFSVQIICIKSLIQDLASTLWSPQGSTNHEQPGQTFFKWNIPILQYFGLQQAFQKKIFKKNYK